MQTMAPVARDTSFQSIVMPECFEVGALYESAEGRGASRPQGLTAKDIKTMFPEFITDLLPEVCVRGLAHVREHVIVCVCACVRECIFVCRSLAAWNFE